MITATGIDLEVQRVGNLVLVAATNQWTGAYACSVLRYSVCSLADIELASTVVAIEAATRGVKPLEA